MSNDREIEKILYRKIKVKLIENEIHNINNWKSKRKFNKTFHFKQKGKGTKFSWKPIIKIEEKENYAKNH